MVVGMRFGLNLLVFLFLRNDAREDVLVCFFIFFGGGGFFNYRFFLVFRDKFRSLGNMRNRGFWF